MTNEEIFAARVARIQSGAAHTKGTIFVGQDEQLQRGRPEVVKQARSREIAGNAAYPLSLLGAFGLGMLAVLLGYYARYQLMAGQTELEDADLEMALSGVIGIALSFVLAQMFRITSKEHKALQGAGVFVMVCSFHNLAHWVPGPMALAFSPEYVAQVQTGTPPNSARFRGVYFPLFDAHSPLAEDLVPALAAAPATEAAPEPAAALAKPACTDTRPKVKMIELDNAKKKPAQKAKPACSGD
jgi:hypothetical protein